MDGNAEISISLDKLPIKRLEAIEENGFERFPSDVGYDEKRVSQIRRIDFAWAVERDSNKKQKKESSTQPWPWQNMVENLHLAHQELSVIIDLINTVETNDAVTVASMTRPKQLPNELLSDLAVSTATKLQCFRHLSKYFKQSSKALEHQLSREAGFYGALIRLQQNWKVKRHRLVASAASSEGFFIDLFDKSVYDLAASVCRPSSMSAVRVDRDSAGMLAICLPACSCRSLQFGFVEAHSDYSLKESFSDEHFYGDDESVKRTHSSLREVHCAIFDEQVFDLVNHEAFNPSLGFNVTGIRENHLELSIGQGTSVYISLVPSGKGDSTADSSGIQISEIATLPSAAFGGASVADAKQYNLNQKSELPHRIAYEIYLQQIFHGYVYAKSRDKPVATAKTLLSSHLVKDGVGLLGHFCMSLAHRIFSNRVLVELESLVSRVPYLHLISHPTWHSRTSSWTLFMKFPQSILHAYCQDRALDANHMKNIKSQFRATVSVNDDCINIEGEGAPNSVGLCRGSSEEFSYMNRYGCDLADLLMILLQQFASQIIRWLHKEALMVGMKANRDFLCLSFELDKGELLSLVAHVDPEDPQSCISWWLIMEDGFTEEHKLSAAGDVYGGLEHRKFLGYLSLEVLYSTVMDLVSLCNPGGCG